MQHTQRGRFRQLSAVATVAAFALAALLVGHPAQASTGGSPALSAPSRSARVATAKPRPVRPPVAANVSTDGSLPPKPAHARTQRLTPTATAWSIDLTATGPDPLWPTQYENLTATANMDVGPTPYYINIFDARTGATLAICGSGTTCSVSVTQPAPTIHDYTANIADRFGVIQASIIFNVRVTWIAADLRLAADVPTQSVGGTATLTATSSYDFGPSPFWLEIYDSTTGTMLAICGSGTSCTTHVTWSVATTHEYVAYLSTDTSGVASPPVTVQAPSAPSWVTWSDAGWSDVLATLSPVANEVATVQLTSYLTNSKVSNGSAVVAFYDEDAGMAFLGSCTATVMFSGSCSITYFASGFGDHHLLSSVVQNGTTLASSNVFILTLVPFPK